MRPDATKLCPFLFLSFPDFSDVFRLVPGASDRHKLLPLLFPFYISGLYPIFSDVFRMRPTAAKLFPFRIFPIFSDLFRMRPTVTKVLPFPFLLFPDFSDFFRFFSDASRRHKIDRAPCCLETETEQFVPLGRIEYGAHREYVRVLSKNLSYLPQDGYIYNMVHIVECMIRVHTNQMHLKQLYFRSLSRVDKFSYKHGTSSHLAARVLVICWVAVLISQIQVPELE